MGQALPEDGGRMKRLMRGFILYMVVSVPVWDAEKGEVVQKRAVTARTACRYADDVVVVSGFLLLHFRFLRASAPAPHFQRNVVSETNAEEAWPVFW